MPLPIQVPDGTVVLSNRFGDGPFADCQQFIQVVLPQGVEIEGVYNAGRGVPPQRYWQSDFLINSALSLLCDCRDGYCPFQHLLPIVPDQM